MQIAVLLQPMSGDGYRATVNDPFQLSAEGRTQEEAIRNLRIQIEDRASQGVEIVTLRVSLPHRSSPDEPLWAADDITRGWLEGIEQYRKERNEENDPWDAPAEPVQ